MKRIEMAGQRFGALAVLAPAATTGRWHVRCDCGTETVVFGANLRRGYTASCGCRKADTLRRRATVHGGAGTPLYVIWCFMRHRCTSRAAHNWKYYGGRGIAVCERWRSFAAFAADVGPRPTPQHSIDRIDPDGHYEPGNVRWATKLQQRANRSAARRAA